MLETKKETTKIVLMGRLHGKFLCRQAAKRHSIGDAERMAITCSVADRLIPSGKHELSRITHELDQKLKYRETSR